MPAAGVHRNAWAPRGSKENLIVFFGEVLDSDLPSIEIVLIKKGRAHTVFHSEPGRTERKFVFSRLEDVDKDEQEEKNEVAAFSDSRCPSSL